MWFFTSAKHVRNKHRFGKRFGLISENLYQHHRQRIYRWWFRLILKSPISSILPPPTEKKKLNHQTKTPFETRKERNRIHLFLLSLLPALRAGLLLVTKKEKVSGNVPNQRFGTPTKSSISCDPKRKKNDSFSIFFLAKAHFVRIVY